MSAHRERFVVKGIDWLSFSIATVRAPGGVGERQMAEVHYILDDLMSGIWEPIASRHVWEGYEVGGFYKYAMKDLNTPITVRWGSRDGHIHVDVTGQACADIRAVNAIEKLAEVVGTRASRVDLAVDLETEDEVLFFIDNGYNPVFKSHGFIQSATGDTYYIGSRKSERMARVYRYHAPHPRHKSLRVEVELKGKAAKRLLEFFSQKTDLTESDLVDLALEPFEFKSPLLYGQMPLDLSLPRASARLGDGGGIRWVMKQVVPALVNMHNAGTLDLEWLWDTVVFPQLLTTNTPLPPA